MIRIAYFCNHWFALPSLFTLKERGVLAGVAVPGNENQVHTQIESAAGKWGVSFKRIPRIMDTEDFNAWFETIRADTAFVMTFPYKIPVKVLSLPKNGFLNFHPGILPKYRGREPIFWQIYNQELFGGISVHKMDEHFDTGPLLHIEKVPILKDDTYGLHLNKLSITAQKAVIKTIDILCNPSGDIPPVPQDTDKVFHATRPIESDLMVRWNLQCAAGIQALVRATNPWCDGAMVNLRGILFHLVQVSTEEKNGLKVQCCDGKILCIEIIKGNEGIFSGPLFARLYGLKPGDAFISPSEDIRDV